MYKDKNKQRDYQAQWYKRNKERHISNVRKNESIYRDSTIAFIKDYLMCHPCVDCGESDWVVLEFDHVRGKKLHNISSLMHNGSSLSKIKEEVSKCDVRCANCHRRVTASRGRFYRSL